LTAATLIIHSDDDQIVLIGPSSRLDHGVAGSASP